MYQRMCTKEHDFKIPSMIETIMRYYSTYWSDKKDDSISFANEILSWTFAKSGRIENNWIIISF